MLSNDQPALTGFKPLFCQVIKVNKKSIQIERFNNKSK